MCISIKVFSLVIVMLLFRGITVAQLPIEVFAGQEKTTVDIMFFKFFKNKEKQNSKLLFFNRNRASIDYKMTETTNLPQFGFTEAISYNDQKLKGVAPVVVLQVFNKGVYPKAGIQYSKIEKDYTIFSWLVCETLKNPTMDFFFLGRYTPKLTEGLNLFTQVELVNAFPCALKNNFNFVQRIRVGFKLKEFQFGAGIDLVENGRVIYTNTNNIGGFLRYEF